MSHSSNLIPLSLYIHTPWCVQKCPYCDFNSHALKQSLPEADYITALIQDLKQNLPLVQDRKLISIFIGGGTPSLFSPNSIATLLGEIQQHLTFETDIEMTLEANPGTVEQHRFEGFYRAGINRLSLGIQSFQDDKLKTLGRIHNAQEATKAIKAAFASGFNNINLDLMYGLPNQTIEDALFDLNTAISFHPTHLSWYQLTIEPNTLFHHQPPKLPDDEHIWQMQTQGQQLLAEHGFEQYEISAYSKSNKQCRHNLNYWEFGDYLGIGAGAHSKMTDLKTHTVQPIWKTKHPKAYLDPNQPYIAGKKQISTQDLPLEFMMNALRLITPPHIDLFKTRTNLKKNTIEDTLQQLEKRRLLTQDQQHIKLTPLGRRFLNDVLANF